MTVDDLKTLTPRERQIVAVLCEGLCNKTIARQLNITEGTVKQHLVNVFRKLNVTKRTTLMAIATLTKGRRAAIAPDWFIELTQFKTASITKAT
jgi:DNA-binding NarL/FixJ family response regulator